MDIWLSFVIFSTSMLYVIYGIFLVIFSSPSLKKLWFLSLFFCGGGGFGFRNRRKWRPLEKRKREREENVMGNEVLLHCRDEFGVCLDVPNKLQVTLWSMTSFTSLKLVVYNYKKSIRVKEHSISKYSDAQIGLM